jgi:hypothetical protein
MYDRQTDTYTGPQPPKGWTYAKDGYAFLEAAAGHPIVVDQWMWEWQLQKMRKDQLS